MSQEVYSKCRPVFDTLDTFPISCFLKLSNFIKEFFLKVFSMQQFLYSFAQYLYLVKKTKCNFCLIKITSDSSNSRGKPG